MKVVLRRWFAVVAFALGLVAFNCRSDVVTIFPSGDSYCRQLGPDLNSGGEQTLVAGCLGDRANRDVRRSFIKFDLTSVIPPGATINSASLNVTVVMVPLGRADSLFEVRRVLSQWNETEVTWDSRMAGVPWQSAGAEGPADTSPAASSTVLITGFDTYTFASTATMVSDVQAWVNDPANNAGWMMESQDELTPKTARRFGAREDPFHPPALTIDYTLAQLSVTVQPPQQTVIEGSTVTFNAVATGTAPLVYQWQFNGNSLAGETIDTLTLGNVQTNQSGLYSVVVSNLSGSVTSAPATLIVTNLPSGLPFVRITSPTNGAKFPSGSGILLSADASETNGTITQVEFFLGTNSVGVDTSEPYSVSISGLAPANYVVTAVATDDRGSNAPSPAVSFSVIGPPGISFTSPSENARFSLGSSVPIAVVVSLNGAKITEVDFFASHFDADAGDVVTNQIGSVSNAPYTINWVPAVAGDYALSAIVRNDLGQATTSTNVDVRVFVAELIPPVIAVTDAPRNFSRLDSSPIFISGTANDNVGLDRVEYQVVSGPLLEDIGPFLPANGTADWNAEVELVPGKNAVRFRSVDLANNKSGTITLFYTYVATAPLSIQIDGSGNVSPNLDGHNLQLGKRYTIAARPDPGFIFAGWQNAEPTNNRVATFEMKQDLVIVANFVPNPFLAIAGNYQGLFFDPDPNRLRPESSGFISINLNKQGALGGKLALNGATYSISGRFDPTGHAQLSIPRPGQSPVAVSLTLDLDPLAGNVSGNVTITGDGVPLNSPLLARFNPFRADNAAPQVGERSFGLQRPGNDEPETIASVRARISAAGAVSLTGLMNERQKFARSSAVAGDGSAPFYVSFNHGSEILIGWLQFGDGSSSEVSGQILHSVPGVPVVEVLEVH